MCHKHNETHRSVSSRCCKNTNKNPCDGEKCISDALLKEPPPWCRYHDDGLIGRPEGERVADFGPRRHGDHRGAGEALAAHLRLHPPVAAGVVELQQASRVRGSRSLFSASEHEDKTL